MILAAVLAVLCALFHWLGRDERVVVLKYIEHQVPREALEHFVMSWRLSAACFGGAAVALFEYLS